MGATRQPEAIEHVSKAERESAARAASNGNGFLSREQILEASDVQTVECHVPEWGGSVLVRGLSGSERDRYEQSITIRRGANQEINIQNARAKLVALCVVDSSGAKVFSQSDVSLLGAKSAAALQRIFDAARKVSGLSDEDMDELTEGFENGRSDDSISA